MSRTRTRNYKVVNGSRRRIYDGAMSYITRASDETCTDEVLRGDGHPFSVNRMEYTGGLVNGQCGTNLSGAFYVNFPVTRYRGNNISFQSHLGIADRPTDAELALKLIKSTNPSRPEVDLPVFLAELKDFPRLFKIAGENLLQKGASANLSYQFGWRPLIGDLGKLVNFMTLYEKRVKEFEALRSKGLRRKRTLWSGSTLLDVPNETAMSSEGIVKYNERWITTQTVSGYVDWKYSGSLLHSPAGLRLQATRAVLGLTLDPATAWELIPFSWLADWCGSVGDYLQSQRNTVGAEWSNLRLMEHLRTEKVCTFVSGPTSRGATFSECRFVRESKRRYPQTPASLSASLPILSKRQVSILASIGILSTKTRR